MLLSKALTLAPIRLQREPQYHLTLAALFSSFFQRGALSKPAGSANTPAQVDEHVGLFFFHTVVISPRSKIAMFCFDGTLTAVSNSVYDCDYVGHF